MLTTRRLSDGITRLETDQLAERHVILAIADLATQSMEYDDPLQFAAGHYLDAQGRCHWYCDVPPPCGDREKWASGELTLEDE